ncbi:UDP-N-acetylmuramate dehydrogenase [Gillisia sp. Q332]|uniref:UDP-N-acetylmuramate dehydrogenase n=1 Tax=Gillisia xinjiangensis TaxID=3384765 RepID=UPI00391D1316
MKIENDFNLRAYNSYKLDCICRRAYFPENENDLIQIFSNTNTEKIILGNGNNTILSKEYYHQDFVIFNGCLNEIIFNGTEIISEGGATLLQMSELALEHSLKGLEMFYDIPSSVGGAVVMNAGSNGEEIGALIKKVRYLDLADLQIKEKSKKELNFTYRNSCFQKNKDKIVLKVWFELEKGEKQNIKAKMEENRNRRWSKQPRDYPNCGSVFKRPEGRFVGPMLDELGLKGYTVGGAQISTKHSGFIVNIGSAKGKDILRLITEVQIKVRERFDVELEVEQRII